MVAEFALAGVLIATSMAVALAALMILHLLVRRRGTSEAPGLFHATEDDAVFLFDDETLVDASDSARSLLDTIGGEGSNWARLSSWLAPRFPGLEEEFRSLAERGHFELHADTPPVLTLRAEWRHGLARIILHDPEAEGRHVAVERLSYRAAEDELHRLRRTLERAPFPVWHESAAGVITWANPAYLMLASARDAEAGVLTWPLPRLFPEAATQPDDVDAESKAISAGVQAPGVGSADPAARPRRMSISGTFGRRWFDCTTFAEADGEMMCFAQPVDGEVRAETALNDFVKTLTQTFASLPVGMAIFDRRRRLQMFNPALTDLTTLDPAFLSSRPTLEQVFDALRDCQMIPEPKDYRSWRESLTEADRAAAAGQFEETWSLTTGQTYRVTGRPHPDGAVAFLIEDISAEISLTRHFRAEIEIGQAVLDSLSEAVAVFSSAGILVMANSAYSRLWSEDPDTGITGSGMRDVLALWQSRAHPGPQWDELRTLIDAGGPRLEWHGPIHLRDGRHLVCRLTPLSGGATLVGFSEATHGTDGAVVAAVSTPLAGSDDKPRRPRKLAASSATRSSRASA
jgi:PAS domain-containing protein